MRKISLLALLAVFSLSLSGSVFADAGHAEGNEVKHEEVQKDKHENKQAKKAKKPAKKDGNAENNQKNPEETAPKS